MHDRIYLKSIATTAPMFALAGAASRFTLRTTETRWQIAAFVAAAACLEAGAHISPQHRSSAVRGFINAAAATMVIIFVKFHLEPAARQADSAVVRNVSKTMVHKIVEKGHQL